MGKRSKSAKSRIKNLGSYSKKWARVTIEDEDEVNDSVQFYDSDLEMAYFPSVKPLNAYRERPTVVAIIFYLLNQILLQKSKLKEFIPRPLAYLRLLPEISL